MKHKWQVKEKKDKKLFGARETPRSGGLWNFKGDSQSKHILVESKQTETKSFSLTEKLLEKVYLQGLRESKIGVISIQLKKHECVVIEKNDFIEICQKAKLIE